MNLQNRLMTCFLLMLTLGSAISTVESDLTHNESETNSDSASKSADEAFRQMVNKLPGIPLGRLPVQTNMREEVQKFREYLRNRPNPTDWTMFTPSPPEQPNCFVEVQVTKKVPGRCTKLGGRIPACQSMDIVTIDYNSC